MLSQALRAAAAGVPTPAMSMPAYRPAQPASSPIGSFNECSLFAESPRPVLSSSKPIKVPEKQTLARVSKAHDNEAVASSLESDDCLVFGDNFEAEAAAEASIDKSSLATTSGSTAPLLESACLTPSVPTHMDCSAKISPLHSALSAEFASISQSVRPAPPNFVLSHLSQGNSEQGFAPRTLPVHSRMSLPRPIQQQRSGGGAGDGRQPHFADGDMEEAAPGGGRFIPPHQLVAASVPDPTMVVHSQRHKSIADRLRTGDLRFY